MAAVARINITNAILTVQILFSLSKLFILMDRLSFLIRFQTDWINDIISVK
jgi:hypothetical protein